MDRRNFLKGAMAVSALGALPLPTSAAASEEVELLVAEVAVRIQEDSTSSFLEEPLVGPFCELRKGDLFRLRSARGEYPSGDMRWWRALEDPVQKPDGIWGVECELSPEGSHVVP